MIDATKSQLWRNNKNKTCVVNGWEKSLCIFTEWVEREVVTMWLAVTGLDALIIQPMNDTCWGFVTSYFSKESIKNV